MRIPIVCSLLCLCLISPAVSDQFKDVPDDHWAAESVQELKSHGVVNGYPDGTFKGDKTVTRYELAVALVSMIDYIENSLKPEVKQQSARADDGLLPGSGGQSKDSSKAAAAQLLTFQGYIAADSPLTKDHDKAISPEELAQALTSVAKRLIENNIPPPKND